MIQNFMLSISATSEPEQMGTLEPKKTLQKKKQKTRTWWNQALLQYTTDKYSKTEANPSLSTLLLFSPQICELQ